MRILGWIFLPFVMIFKNWQQRSVWNNIIGSLFAVSMLSFYVLLLFVSLNGGMFVSSVPSELRGHIEKTDNANPGPQPCVNSTGHRKKNC
jgi:hypothetical protein